MTKWPRSSSSSPSSDSSAPPRCRCDADAVAKDEGAEPPGLDGTAAPASRAALAASPGGTPHAGPTVGSTSTSQRTPRRRKRCESPRAITPPDRRSRPPRTVRLAPPCSSRPTPPPDGRTASADAEPEPGAALDSDASADCREVREAEGAPGAESAA